MRTFPAWPASSLRLGLALALVVLSACRGDLESGTSGNGSGTGDGSGGSSGAGSTGDALGPNLLANPSFESWLGDAPQVWELESVAALKVDDGTEGSLAIESDSPGYGSVGQLVTPADPLPTGTCLHLEASIKWVAGGTQPPAFLMTVTSVDDMEEVIGPQLGWVPDGEWHQSAKVTQLPFDTRALAVSIGNAEADPHTYRLDATSLRVGPCG